MTYQVETSTRAQQDVRAILDWLEPRSLRGAARWHKAYLRAASDLAKDPESRSLAPECEGFDYEVRDQLFKTRHCRRYRLLFTIVEDRVSILRVWAPGQAPVRKKDLPEERDE